jgi:cobalt-zinc-cadmium efflux system membrane fusion protein
MHRDRSILGMLALAGCLLASRAQAAEITLDANDARRLGVETAVVGKATGIEVVGQPGEVRVPNDRLLVLTAPVAAIVTRLWVAEGQAVSSGDLLVELTGAEAADLEAAYRDAAGEQAMLEAESTRIRGLVEDGVLARKDLAEASVRLAHASGVLQGAEAALRSAGTSTERLAALRAGAAPSATLRLRARDPGTVLRQHVRPGERLDLGAPMLELGDLGQLWVEVHVPLDRVRGFSVGDAARVRGGPGVVLEGRIIALGRRVHEADRGLLVRVAIDDPSALLIPGQPVEVDLARSAPVDALEVARSALVSLGADTVLFVDRGGRFEVASVSVLAEREAALVVRGDLREGDRVAIRGTAGLKALLDRVGSEG